MQEAVETCYAEHAAQKARREVEAKAKEEAKKQRIVEEKEKLEYIQRLWDEVIAEDATLLKGAEGFQITEYKCREAPPGDNADYQPSKKAKGKQPARYQGDMGIKLGEANPYERCVLACPSAINFRVHYLRNFIFGFPVNYDWSGGQLYSLGESVGHGRFKHGHMEYGMNRAHRF